MGHLGTSDGPCFLGREARAFGFGGPHLQDIGLPKRAASRMATLELWTANPLTANGIELSEARPSMPPRRPTTQLQAHSET